MIMTIFSLVYNSVYFVTTVLYDVFLISHTVLPFGIDVALFGLAVYNITRLKYPSLHNVNQIFGPTPGSRESELHPYKVVNCIAHRGAGLDAPENTLQAFQYCVENNCNFVEVDVRTSKDGHLMLLHDQGLERLTGSNITDVKIVDWDTIKNLDIGATHPNRHQFKEVRLCLLEDAVEFLLSREAKMIIDLKGNDSELVTGILNIFKNHPGLYTNAVVTTFNPFILYQIRKQNPKIVGAISYRPYCFSAETYDSENGPTNQRFADRLPLHLLARIADFFHSRLWRLSARWCAVSAVLVHKDIVSPSEVSYWRSLNVRCAGWCVNRPLEKLYWRSVLKAPYLANTLVGEPEMEQKKIVKAEETGEKEKMEKMLSTGEN